MAKTLFISYHGNVDGGDSSLALARTIKNDLEKLGIKCFLYAEERDDDFYDKIHTALLEYDNFMLVVNDKRGFNSLWVRDEVKIFDSLVKNKIKTNGKMFAFLSGDVKRDDLFRFNPVFVSKDIIEGSFNAETFASLLVEDITEEVLSNIQFSPSNVYISDISLPNLLDLNSIIDKIDDDDFIRISKRYSGDLSLAASPFIQEVIEGKHEDSSGQIYIFSANNVYAHVYHLAQILPENSIVIFIQEDNKGTVVSLIDKKVRVNVNSFSFPNGTLEIKPVDENTIEVFWNGESLKEIDIDNENDFFKEYSCIDINLNTKQDEEGSFKYNPAKLLLYILDNFASIDFFKTIDETTKQMVFRDVELYRQYSGASYDFVEMSSFYYKLEKLVYLHDEILLSEFIQAVKCKTDYSSIASEFEDEKYIEISKKICRFYLKKSEKEMREIVDNLLKIAEDAKDFDFRKHNFVLRLATELVINNIFLFGTKFIYDHNMVDSLKKEIMYEPTKIAKYELLTHKYILQKEYVFNGEYKFISDTYDNALNAVLKNISELIEQELEDNKRINSTFLSNYIAMAIRHRCVIYERLGDNEVDNEKRKYFYMKWTEDAKYVMDLEGKIDYETIGSARLNYVYASMRFINDIKDIDEKVAKLDVAIEEAEKTYKILEYACSQRIISYAYLQICEACYERLFLNSLALTDESDRYINLMRKNAFLAYSIVDKTNDTVAQTMAYRFMSCVSLLNGIKDNDEKMIIDGLKKIDSATTISANNTLVREGLKDIAAVSVFLKLLSDFDGSHDYNECIKKVILSETRLIMSIIHFIKMDDDGYRDLQKHIDRMFERMNF